MVAALRATLGKLPDSYAEMSLASLLDEASMAEDEGTGTDAHVSSKGITASLEMLQSLELSSMTIDDLIELGDEYSSGRLPREELLKRFTEKDETYTAYSNHDGEL